MGEVVTLPVAAPTAPATPIAGEQSIRERIDAKQYPVDESGRQVVPLRGGAFATMTSTTLVEPRCLYGFLDNDEHSTTWRANGQWYAVDGVESVLDIMPPVCGAGERVVSPPVTSKASDGERALFLNRLRSLRCIDGYLLPELSETQQQAFMRNPWGYVMAAPDGHAAAIWREVEKRQTGKSVTARMRWESGTWKLLYAASDLEPGVDQPIIDGVELDFVARVRP